MVHHTSPNDWLHDLCQVMSDSMLLLLQDKVAKWWLPDDIVFVKDMPMTATGKVSKLLLRERFKNHALFIVSSEQ